jgi:hypothetical protein
MANTTQTDTSSLRPRTHREAPPTPARVRLVLLSFLMLFVELALIRWSGSNVLYLSYFSNFVLLGSFLGIGIGFLRADRRHNLAPYAPVALAALVAFVRFFPVEVRRSGSDVIFLSRRVTFRRPVRLYGALVVALLVAWAIPLDRLLSLDLGPRFLAAVAIAFAPIFLANLVFTQRFKDVSASGAAFGANLLGAMVGGLIEYSALVVGYRALLVLVAVLYGLAFTFGRRYLTSAPVAGA